METLFISQTIHPLCIRPASHSLMGGAGGDGWFLAWPGLVCLNFPALSVQCSV